MILRNVTLTVLYNVWSLMPRAEVSLRSTFSSGKALTRSGLHANSQNCTGSAFATPLLDSLWPSKFKPEASPLADVAPTTSRMPSMAAGVS